MPASHPLVVATAFAGWEPLPAAGAGAQCQLPQYKALRLFIRRCAPGPLPADLAASRNTRLLMACLLGPSWTRILDELIASGLLNQGLAFSNEHELHEHVLTLTISTPANLLIGAADYDTAEDTAAVAPVAYQPAQARQPRRGGRPAVPPVPAVQAVPGRPALASALVYLDELCVADLVGGGDAPLSRLAYLAGLLGPMYSQAERNRSRSNVYIAARALAGGARARFSLASDDTSSLAYHMPSFLSVLETALPSMLRVLAFDARSLLDEGYATLQYDRDDAGRRATEQSRIYCLAPQCAPRPRPSHHGACAYSHAQGLPGAGPTAVRREALGPFEECPTLALGL